MSLNTKIIKHDGHYAVVFLDFQTDAHFAYFGRDQITLLHYAEVAVAEAIDPKNDPEAMGLWQEMQNDDSAYLANLIQMITTHKKMHE